MGEEGEDFVDTIYIRKHIDKYHLAGYFLETRKKAIHRTAMSWLETCDKDTLLLICQYANKINMEQSEETLMENKSQDLFDNPPPEEDDDDEEKEFQEKKSTEIISEMEDLNAITALILAWEHDTGGHESHFVPCDVLDESVVALTVYATMELMRREGLVKPKGSGKLMSKKTKFFMTPKGKKIGPSFIKKIKEGCGNATVKKNKAEK